MTTGLAELRQGLRQGDPSTIQDRWREGAAALRESVAAELPERQRGMFGRLAEQMIASGTGNVLALQTQRTGEVGRGNYVRGVDDLVRGAASAATPEERAEALAQIEAMTDAAVEGGLVAPDVAARVLVGARARLDRLMASQAVTAQRGRGPAAVRDMPGLSPELRAELEAQAAREMVEHAAEAEAEERTAIVEHQGVVTETLSRAMGGQASLDDVMALRHEADPVQYRAAMTVASGQAATRDVTAEVDDLTARVGIEAEGSYRQRLDNALAVQAITPETHARLRDLDLSLRAQDPATSNRRQAREAILDALDVDDLEGDMDLGAPFTRIRTSTLNAFEEWTAANPNAGPTERREALNAAIMVGLDETVRTAMRVLPPLSSVATEPGQPPKLDDLDKAEADLLDALDAMEASADAGDAVLYSAIVDELALMERWRAISVFSMEVQAGQTNIFGNQR